MDAKEEMPQNHFLPLQPYSATQLIWKLRPAKAILKMIVFDIPNSEF